MWRYLLILLITLPPLTIILNHDVISAVMIIGWTAVIIPLCILQVVDFLRNDQARRPLWMKKIVKVLVALFGSLSFLMGVSIVMWCLYNLVIQRLPEYTGPTDAVGLWLSGFGIGPTLISFGWYLLRLAGNRTVKQHIIDQS